MLDLALDTVRRAAEVFTANDRWPQLTDVMMDRFHAFKLKGRYHAGLANLLLELGQKGRLSEEDVEVVKLAHRGRRKDSTLVPPTNGQWADPSESMGAVLQSISTGNSSSAGVLAPRLFSRHGPFGRWATIWWGTLLKALLEPERGSSPLAVVDAALAHVEAVEDNMDKGFDAVVSAWLSSLTVQAGFELMRTQSALSLCSLLLNLAAHRRVHIVPQIMDKLVYATWKQAAALSLSSRGKLDAKHIQAVENAIILAQHFLLAAPPSEAGLPPTNLRQSLILQTERGQVFNSTNAPILIRHLPFLIVLDSARGATERIRSQILTLLQGLATTPQFKAAAFRHVDVLKDAFLSVEWSKSSVDPSLEASMVDALKLIMSQGSSSSANPHSIQMDLSSRSSAWRWTSIVLSMRVEFKRLAMRIEADEEADEARATLHQLVRSTLDRELSADDADLLCEAFRGIECVVVHEICAVGFDRLSALLSQMIGAENQSSLEMSAQSVDLMLRILNGATVAVQPGSADHTLSSARHGLVELISVAIQSVERQLNEDNPPLLDGVVPPSPGSLFATVVKMLKFVLGLDFGNGVTTTAPQPDFARLAGSFLRVISVSDAVLTTRWGKWLTTGVGGEGQFEYSRIIG